MEEEEAFADSGGSCARIFIFVLFFGGKGGFGPFATSTVFWSFFAISATFICDEEIVLRVR